MTSLSSVSRLFERATYVLATLAGICLLFMMGVIAASVIMRYVVGQPILGVNEIVQLTAVAMVMAALPFCTFHNAHIAVDVLDNHIGKWGRLIGDIGSRLLSGLVLALLCRRAILKVLDTYEFNDTTNMLSLPLWPFYAILAAGSGLCVLIFAEQIIMRLAGHENAMEHGT
ncbi:TRAP transporter small permease [Nioella aestuarii]|uniref:TRAP transporter small permease n=1 Tax=Nioella aestuarii TaxID=1662864 RepID=UPI003D7F581F